MSTPKCRWCCYDGPTLQVQGVGIGCEMCGAHWNPGDAEYEELRETMKPWHNCSVCGTSSADYPDCPTCGTRYDLCSEKEPEKKKNDVFLVKWDCGCVGFMDEGVPHYIRACDGDGELDIFERHDLAKKTFKYLDKESRIELFNEIGALMADGYKFREIRDLLGVKNEKKNRLAYRTTE